MCEERRGGDGDPDDPVCEVCGVGLNTFNGYYRTRVTSMRGNKVDHCIEYGISIHLYCAAHAPEGCAALSR